MRTVNEVLDAVKARNGITSDYKLAMFLGIGDGNLRNYRHGRSLPDEKACERIASALGEQPFVLLAEMQAQRSRSTEARSLWEQLANQLRHAVAAVMMACGVAMLLLAPNPQGAQASPLPYDQQGPGSVHYVKLKRRRLNARSRGGPVTNAVRKSA